MRRINMKKNKTLRAGISVSSSGFPVWETFEPTIPKGAV
jgi:hypothetical protein